MGATRAWIAITTTEFAKPNVAAFCLGGALSALSGNALALTAEQVFEKAAPSVVVVQARDKKGKRIALGSGVGIAPNEVVTNCHVVGAESSILVSRLGH